MEQKYSKVISALIFPHGNMSMIFGILISGIPNRNWIYICAFCKLQPLLHTNDLQELL